jgi:hypothetical protein
MRIATHDSQRHQSFHSIPTHRAPLERNVERIRPSATPAPKPEMTARGKRIPTGMKLHLVAGWAAKLIAVRSVGPRLSRIGNLSFGVADLSAEKNRFRSFGR